MKRLELVAAIGALIVFLAAAHSLGAGQDLALQGQRDPEMTVPAGTVIPIVLTAFLNTRGTQVGDRFYADTTYPVWIQQKLVIPRGSTVRGTVTDVVRPGKIKGKGRLAVRFDDILLPNGVSREMVASFRGLHGPGDERIDRKSETVEQGGTGGVDAGEVVGSTSQGAIIGAIAGGGKGAGIGAGAGALAGLVTILFTRGRDLILAPGTQFDLELKQPMRFAYGELEFTTEQINSARFRPPASPQGNLEQNRPRYSPRPYGFPIPWPF